MGRFLTFLFSGRMETKSILLLTQGQREGEAFSGQSSQQTKNTSALEEKIRTPRDEKNGLRRVLESKYGRCQQRQVEHNLLHSPTSVRARSPTDAPRETSLWLFRKNALKASSAGCLATDRWLGEAHMGLFNTCLAPASGHHRQTSNTQKRFNSAAYRVL